MYSRCQLYRTKEGWYIVCLLQMFNNCIIILYNFICPRLVSLSNYMKGHSKSIVHIVYCGIWLGRTKNCMLCIGRSHQALKEVVEHLQIPIGKYSVSDGIENSLSWGLHDTDLIKVSITFTNSNNNNNNNKKKKKKKEENYSNYTVVIIIIIIIIIINDIYPGSSTHSKVIFREVLHPFELG